MADRGVHDSATAATLLTGSRFAALAAPPGHLSDELAAAINRCCDARGDSSANRQGLLNECRFLSAKAQADLQEHFEQEVARRACQTATVQRRT